MPLHQLLRGDAPLHRDGEAPPPRVPALFSRRADVRGEHVIFRRGHGPLPPGLLRGRPPAPDGTAGLGIRHLRRPHRDGPSLRPPTLGHENSPGLSRLRLLRPPARRRRRPRLHPPRPPPLTQPRGRPALRPRLHRRPRRPRRRRLRNAAQGTRDSGGNRLLPRRRPRPRKPLLQGTRLQPPPRKARRWRLRRRRRRSRPQPPRWCQQQRETQQPLRRRLHAATRRRRPPHRKQ
mmetsp:Transcript_24631/g.79616  ORF Transcript_24631/g.79616 Transcript_24631/m.79616 type:complete len:234 (-) Transcript_24631:761-1462(-)